MRRGIATMLITTAAVLTAVAPAWALGDTGTHEVGHSLRTVVFTGEGGARGHVQLASGPGGQTRVRGMIIGILISVVQRLELGAAEQSCGTARPGDYARIGASFYAGADGTALIEPERTLDARPLRHARSLAVLAGADGPVVACGALEAWAVRPDAGEAADAVVVSGGRVDARPVFLAGVMGSLDGTSNTLATFARLEPETPHALVLSRRSCGELAQGAEPLALETHGFRTGADGTAHLMYELQDVMVSSLRDVRSLAVTEGPEAVVTCAAVSAAAVDRLPPGHGGRPRARTA